MEYIKEMYIFMGGWFVILYTIILFIGVIYGNNRTRNED